MRGCDTVTTGSSSAILGAALWLSLAPGVSSARVNLGSLGILIGGLGVFVVATHPAWPVQAAAFAVMGLGFYMLHASIQVYVTEFAPASRSSAVASGFTT